MTVRFLWNCSEVNCLTNRFGLLMEIILMLVLVGLVLIFAEILVIPGVGVAGILGLLSLGGACFYAFYEYGTVTGALVTAGNALLLLAMTIYVLRAKTWKRFTLHTNIDSKAVVPGKVVSVGDRGVTMTRLAPMGTVRFDGEPMEVTALEGMAAPGIEVEVVLIDDNKVFVKPVGEEF